MSTAVSPNASDGNDRRGDASGESGKTAAPRRRRSLPWRRIFGAAALAAVVLAVAWAVIYFTPLFSVKNVAVHGNEHLEADEVVAAAGVETGAPLAQVNLRGTASNVVSMPWVKSATATRKWPSTVAVKIEENTAVAFTKDSDGTHLLDPDGKEFAVDTPPDTAVELTGSTDSDDAARKDAVEIAAALSEKGRGSVESIEAKSKYEFVLHLKDDKTVVWGASEDNANKALAVDTVLQREGAEFNVTNPRQITVK